MDIQYSFMVFDNDLESVLVTAWDDAIFASEPAITITDSGEWGAIGYVRATPILGTPGVGQVTIEAASQGVGSDPGDTGVASATCSITTYDITGWAVEERAWGETAWHAPEDGHVLWADNSYRWQVETNPADILQTDGRLEHLDVEWRHMAWTT